MVGVWIIFYLLAGALLSPVVAILALWLASGAVVAQRPTARVVVLSGVVLWVIWTGSIGAVGLAAATRSAVAVGIVALLAAVTLPLGVFLVLHRAFRTPWPASAALTILYAVLQAGFAFGFQTVLTRAVMMPFVCAGGAMAPTFRDGDRFLVLRRTRPERWQMIVYQGPTGQPYVHRVVGLPGETVLISASGLAINGVAVEPPDGVPRPADARSASGGVTAPATLGPDEYFVVGDNAAESLDSRFFGVTVGGQTIGVVPGATRPWSVPRDRMLGIVGLRYWPPDRADLLE